MKEIELRLALVFYGGVSLAIYMHGVSREILNLVRASARRSARTAGDGNPASAAQNGSPSEQAYAKLLSEIGSFVDLRVVTDVIAGASAGGVNGIMLARAIAHDLPIDGHRDLWLKNADVSELARPQDGLAGYLKSGVSPMLDRLVSAQLKKKIDEPETREKLRRFMQSRWFSPPFSGESYIGWMLDACREMDHAGEPGRSLIPRGQALDLFVTLTDYTGSRRRIRIDDPAYIEEWDHRKILTFEARHRASGELDSELGSGGVPELVFAARATSSFPGAFPPATIAEMDRVLHDRGDAWPNRDVFMRNALELSGNRPERHCFVDGSVVMNKPFAPVVEAIKRRPAAREVARRLVYVDPVPPSTSRSGAAGEELPGFFRVIFASMAHIPRNEPIGDELRDIEARNRRGRWLAKIIAAADPVVDKAVRRILPLRLRMRPETLTRTRERANAAAHAKAGYAFLNYQALKLHAVAERLAVLATDLARAGGRKARAEGLNARIGGHFEALAATPLDGPLKPDPGVVRVLRAFDVDYRVRRLRFAIRKLNELYQAHGIPTTAGGGPVNGTSNRLDQLKSVLYEQIDAFNARWTPEFFSAASREAAEALCLQTRIDPTDGSLGDAALFRFFDAISEDMGLAELDRTVDEIFGLLAADLLDGGSFRALVQAYVGFAFYDLVMFPVLQRNDFSEVNETLVDRISPQDATSLYEEGFELKGSALNAFGAFFNRGWREHDYLWGRLNTADRLISILLSVSSEIKLPDAVVLKLRQTVFQAIIDEERPHLTAIGSDIERLQARIDELVQNGDEPETIRRAAFHDT
ncbi:MAG: patatin-like protein [Roseibium sp.]|nr:patatin-like protein [Roseibium sp.]